MEGTREEGVEGYLLIDKRASSRGPFFSMGQLAHALHTIQKVTSNLH